MDCKLLRMGVRGGLRDWLFALGCGGALLTGCGRTAKNSGAGTQAEAGAAGAPAAVNVPNCAVSIAANRSRHCAVYQDGSVWCWGTPGPDTSGPAPSNWQGSTEPQKVEVEPATRVVLGPRHSCAITQAGRLSCWGDNDAGQIDDSGVSPLSPTPVTLSADGLPAPIKHVGLGEQQTCIVNALSHVFCRGGGASGPGPQQLDVAGEPDTTMPGSLPFVFDQRGVAFDPNPGAAAVEASMYGRDNAWIGQGNPETCLLKRWGSLWCTDYLFGQSSPFKAKLQLGENVVQAGTGELFVCALTTDGLVWCEGFDKVGQTGNGANADFAEGAFVPALSDVRAISVNGWSACALKLDGSVWCWGAYAEGAAANTPTLVSDCHDQVTEPPAPNPFAGLTRNSADRLAEAGRARGQAVCESVPGTDRANDAGCIAEEDFTPNADCIGAVGSALFPYWDCRAWSLWQEAACFAQSGSSQSLLPCSPAPGCGERERPAAEAYCTRRGCTLDQSQNISPQQLCDGTPDCDDASDELNCDRQQHSFDCREKLIPVSALCDGTPDCDDGSDETYCP
jgi:hypothetical protein